MGSLKSLGLVIALTATGTGLIGLSSSFAAKSGKTPPPGADAAAHGGSSPCPTLLAKSTGLKGSDALFEVHSIYDLVAADPAQNLAVQHPSIVMDAFQRYYHVIRRYPSRKILNPTYRTRSMEVFPVFSDGVPEAEQALIVSQYDALQTIVEYFRSGASGDRMGKMLLLKGPAGTGKTEVLNILDRVQARLSLENPDYFQYTFRWKNLYEVDELKYLTEEGAPPLDLGLRRSPLVLLPEEIQDRVIELATPRVQERLGFPPLAWKIPDPQTEEILKSLKISWQRKNPGKLLDEESLLELLDQHVEIVRRLPNLNQPPALLRYQGKHPEYTQLLFSENFALQQLLGQSNPLSYHYNGKILRFDGAGLLVDEFFRNGPQLRDTFLEIGQNRVVAWGGAPEIRLDVVTILASNDVSIEEAEQDGGAQAHLDRTVKQPMRQPIHPLEIGKTTLLMVGQKRFLMKKLGSDGNPPTGLPANLNELYPAATADGLLQGPDGRYSVFYSGDGQNPVLISPHTLELLGMTIGATRMITDPKALDKIKTEVDIAGPDLHYFTDEKSRLEVLLSLVQVSSGLRERLYRVKEKLREGEKGISARDAETWLKTAIAMAQQPENEGTLTPALLDQAFIRLLDSEKILPSKDLRARWLLLHRMVKSEFMLDLLEKDILAVIAGDGGRVDRLYEEIKREVQALTQDARAKFTQNGPGGDRIPINRERLDEIKKIYLEINGREFDIQELKSFHFQVTETGSQFIPLRRAIERFLMRKEIDTATLTELLDFFHGNPVREETRRLAQTVDSNLAKYGYNRRAFLEALRLVRDLSVERGGSTPPAPQE